MQSLRFPNFSTDLDLMSLKYLEADEARKYRHQRNQEILDKIQQLRSKSTLDSSRSETFRQLQIEHKALVQKYSNRQRAWFRNSISTENPGQAISRSSKICVSTGINTDLSGPVQAAPFHSTLDVNSTNEQQHFSSNQNRHPRNSVPENEQWNFQTQSKMNPSTSTAPPFPEQQHTESIEEPRRTSRFFNISTTDSDITGTTETEDGPRGQKLERRMSAFMTPTVAAIQKFLTDDTSDTTGSLSMTSRRTSIAPIPISNMMPIFSEKPKEQNIEIRKVSLIRKEDIDANVTVENEDLGESFGATSVGDSVMDSFHQEHLTRRDSFSVSKEDTLPDYMFNKNTNNEKNENTNDEKNKKVVENESKLKINDPKIENVSSPTSIENILTNPQPQGHWLAAEESRKFSLNKTEIQQLQQISATPTTTATEDEQDEETDDLSYSDADANQIQPGNDSAKPASAEIKSDLEAKTVSSKENGGAGEREIDSKAETVTKKENQNKPLPQGTAASQPNFTVGKLKLTYDDDSESENSLNTFSKLAKTKVMGGTEGESFGEKLKQDKGKEKDKNTSETADEDGDLDDFFDL